MTGLAIMEDDNTWLNNAATHIDDISNLTKYAAHLINSKQ